MIDGAHNTLLDLEELEEEDLLKMRANYLRLAQEAREALRKGRTDTNVPGVDTKPRSGVRRLKNK